MQQSTFEDMFNGFVQEIVHLEESVKKELLIYMAAAIVEVFKSERRRIDDNLFE